MVPLLLWIALAALLAVVVFVWGLTRRRNASAPRPTISVVHQWSQIRDQAQIESGDRSWTNSRQPVMSILS